MTEHGGNLEQALEEHDVTLAMTPGQLLLLVAGLYLLLRFLRSLRG